ncbi:MAG: hypothetical protein JWP54_1543 [Cryobacterium sp.]|nr:hypothetical protein [Cryobacterium sp.]
MREASRPRVESQAREPLRARGRFTLRDGYGVGRLLLAAAGIVGLIGNYEYVLLFPAFSAYNVFTYFTVQSAIAGVVAFVLGAIVAFRRERDPQWLDVFRALVTTYILVSGIVFLTIVIQSSSRDYTIDVPWPSQVLHFYIPSIALLDWLTDTGKARLSWRFLPWILPYPLAWGIFTLVRGSMVGWYPYFFLDPAQVSGPLETALYCLVAVVLFLGIAALLVATSRLSWRPQSRGAGGSVPN